MPTKTELAVQEMERIANDPKCGYDQNSRWGPDYDCSSLVIHAWEKAGVPVKTAGASYTGNIYQIFLQNGFKDVTNDIILSSGGGCVRGDVLLNIKSHVACYAGDGKQVEALINEFGGITGGKTGDQTGWEITIRGYQNKPWDKVLRYKDALEPEKKDFFLQHCLYIICYNEGAISGDKIVYDLIEYGDTPHGIGILQWTFTRSFDLLRDIYIENGNNFGDTNPPQDIREAIENNVMWGDYFFTHGGEANKWVREFLRSKNGKKVQSNKAIKEVAEYVEQINGQGVTNRKAAAYGVDVGNQYGTNMGKVFGMARYNSSHNSLDKIHNATPQTYATRRKWVYDYLNGLKNWESPPPVEFDITDENDYNAPASPDPIATQDPDPIITDDPKVIQEASSKMANTIAYKSGNYFINKFIKAQKLFNNAILLEYNLDYIDIPSNVIEEVAEKEQEERDKDKNNSVEEELNKIPDEKIGIERVIEQTRAYGYYAVPYSSLPPRDMKKNGDNSSFVDLCFQSAGLNLGSNTRDIYNTCEKLNKIVVVGGKEKILEILTKSKRGDIILMSLKDNNFLGGSDSHIGIVTESNKFCHMCRVNMNGYKNIGPALDDLSQFLTVFATDYIKYCLARPLDF